MTSEPRKDEKVSKDELSDKDLAKATGGGNTMKPKPETQTQNTK